MPPRDSSRVRDRSSTSSDVDLEQSLDCKVAAGKGFSRRRAALVGIPCICLAALLLALCTHGWGSGHGSAKQGDEQGSTSAPEIRGAPADKDGDGQIDSDELADFSERAVKWFDIEAMSFEEKLEETDEDEDGLFGLEEVQPFVRELWITAGPDMPDSDDQELRAWEIAAKAWMPERNARQVLKMADEDGDGFLAGTDMSELKRRVGLHYIMDDQAVQKILDDADSDGDGAVTQFEVPKLLTGLRKAFKELDDDAIKKEEEGSTDML